MDSLTFWETQPTDKPWLVNGFNGTWAFTDHNLIPDSLRNFIWANFPKHERFRRIPLDEINALMNSVWEGPGSMVKIERLYQEIKAERVRTGLDKGVKVYTETAIPKDEDDDDFEEPDDVFEDEDLDQE